MAGGCALVRQVARIDQATEAGKAECVAVDDTRGESSWNAVELVEMHKQPSAWVAGEQAQREMSTEVWRPVFEVCEERDEMIDTPKVKSQPTQ